MNTKRENVTPKTSMYITDYIKWGKNYLFDIYHAGTVCHTVLCFFLPGNLVF